MHTIRLNGLPGSADHTGVSSPHRIGLVLPRPAGRWPGHRDLATKVLEVLMLWHERARQRRRLLELDDRMLRDIGVSRADAVREAAKPFWQE